MTTFQFLLLLFIIVPILEIYLLITVSNVIGGFTTISLVIFTAILGTYLLRIQGLATLQKAQTSLSQGQAGALLEGILLLISGVLLLTPGFVTDIVGFTCLIPPIRQRLVNLFIKKIKIVNPSYTQQSNKPDVIEGEYKRDD
ncbi:MAG TPA: FxsA family protein [Thioploca sp.]|nr:FxsA family protein [Thioploca sp.]